MRKISDRYYLIIISLVVVLSFVIRYIFRSNYLDEWDSVNFALAIKDYSISLHQPHPPGYPIYIFFGRVVDYFLNDPVQSLIFISIIFGSLSIMSIYLISSKFFDKRVGIISAVILSLTPAHMFFSEVAMSDITGLFFEITTVYLLYIGLENKRYLYFASFILGITVGIRATDIILLILFLIAVYINRTKLKEFIISIFLILLGIGIWLIPVVQDTGFDTLIRLQENQWKYNSADRTINNGLNYTLDSMGQLFIDGWTWVIFIFVLITIMFIMMKMIDNFDKSQTYMKLRSYLFDKRVIFIILWLSLYFIFSISNNTLYISRYILPMFPPLSMIFAYSMIKTIDGTQKKTKISLSIIFIIIIISMSGQSVIDIYNIHTTIPAPVMASQFIRENFNPDNTVIIAQESFKHFQYYLPNFVVKYSTMTLPEEIYNYTLENKTIISDELFTMSSIHYKEFRRDKIYPKHEVVMLYENTNYSSQQFIVPKNSGWFSAENWNGILSRWMGSDAKLIMYSDHEHKIVMNFQASGFYRPKTLEVFDEETLVVVDLIDIKFDKIIIPMTIKKGTNLIRFHIAEGCEKPSEISELRSKDTRCFGMAVQNVTID